MRQGIAAVGGDLDVEHRVGPADERLHVARRAGCPAGSTMIPRWSSPRPSSRAEQIIPSEMRPYVSRAPIAKPPGSTAPGNATGTRSPTTKFVAPQTIPRSGPPSLTGGPRRSGSAS